MTKPPKTINPFIQTLIMYLNGLYSFAELYAFGMELRSCLSSKPLMIPAPWVLLHIGWFITLVPHWVIVSYFLAGHREAELNLTVFFFHSYFSMFPVFPLLLTSRDIVPLCGTCWGYSLIIIIIYIYISLCRLGGKKNRLTI